MFIYIFTNFLSACFINYFERIIEISNYNCLIVYFSFHSDSFCFMYFVAVFSCYPFTTVKYMTCPTWSQGIFSKVYTVAVQCSCRIVSVCIITLFHPLLFTLESLNLNCVTKISTPRQRKRKSYPFFFFYCLIFPLCLGTGTFVFFLLRIICVS